MQMGCREAPTVAQTRTHTLTHTHTRALVPLRGKSPVNCCNPGSNAIGFHTNVPSPRHASSSSPSPAPQLCVSSFHVRRSFNGNFRNAQRKTSQFSQLLACVFPPTLSSSNFSMSKVFLVRESHKSSEFRAHQGSGFRVLKCHDTRRWRRSAGAKLTCTKHQHARLPSRSLLQ